VQNQALGQFETRQAKSSRRYWRRSYINGAAVAVYTLTNAAPFDGTWHNITLISQEVTNRAQL